MKKNQNGSFTIEASFVVPIILMVFMASVYIIFYFHDKNILSGAAYETAVVGSERKSYKKEELEAYFRRRIKGKLIVFSNVKENIEVEKEEITVTCSAKKRRMKINVSASVKQTEPETYIRNVRKIKNRRKDRRYQVKACYKNDLKKAYLILEGVESEAEDYQIYMLKENTIPGLLKTDIRYVDNISQYYYDISGKVSLKAIHEKANLSYEEMKNLVYALLRTIKTIRKFMLEANCILLDPEYIYCEKEEFYFCYFPRCECELKEEFHRLTEYFVSEVNYREKEGVHFAYSIHKASMEENYSIERIMNELVEAVQEEKKEERMIPAVNYEERMEEQGIPEIHEKKDFWEPVKRLLDKKKKGKWGYWDEIHIEQDDL